MSEELFQHFVRVADHHLQQIGEHLTPGMQMVLICFDPAEQEADICLTARANIPEAIEALRRCEARRLSEIAQGYPFGKDGMPVVL